MLTMHGPLNVRLNYILWQNVFTSDAEAKETISIL